MPKLDALTLVSHMPEEEHPTELFNGETYYFSLENCCIERLRFVSVESTEVPMSLDTFWGI